MQPAALVACERLHSLLFFQVQSGVRRVNRRIAAGTGAVCCSKYPRGWLLRAGSKNFADSFHQVDTFLASVLTQSARAAIEPEVEQRLVSLSTMRARLFQSSSVQVHLLCRFMYHGFTTAAGRITIGQDSSDKRCALCCFLISSKC